MSEMSLTQQILLIKEMKEYILLVASEADNMRDELTTTIDYLRQQGLPSEVADTFFGPFYMGHVYKELDALLERMLQNDYRYLDDKQQQFERLLKWK